MEEDERGEGGDLEESFLVGGWALGRAEENGEGAGRFQRRRGRGRLGKMNPTRGPRLSAEKKEMGKGGGRGEVFSGWLAGLVAPGWPSWAAFSLFFVLVLLFIFCFHFCVV
jgi:hypothetical protein